MAEPFKNLINETVITELADWLDAAGPFDRVAFVAGALDGLDQLELKDRVRHVSEVLRRHLEPDYRTALSHLISALPPPLEGTDNVTSSIGLWSFCQLIETYGVDDPDVSLPALYELTRRFSAEFAIRPYLIRWPEMTFAALRRWAADPDPHVRRLVSEGTRPRLPWGIRLHGLIDDPSPVLPLLEALRDDPEEYVRRSVANHLNDLAKDHPELVVEICARWSADATPERKRLIRHALRTLLKQGHPSALELLGFGPPAIELFAFDGPVHAQVGDTVALRLRLRSTVQREQRLLIDYALHFPGARGRTNRKVFKWTTRELAAGAVLEVEHGHSLQPVSTRATRPGSYRFELLVNGRSVAEHTMQVEG